VSGIAAEKRTNGRGRGALIFGQNVKKLSGGALLQGPEPPPQLDIPEAPIRDAPIMTITVPRFCVNDTLVLVEKRCITCDDGRKYTL